MIVILRSGATKNPFPERDPSPTAQDDMGVFQQPVRASRHKAAIVFFLLALIILGKPVAALAGTLTLDQRGQYFPEPQIDVLLDKGKTLSVLDMEKPKISSSFHPYHWLGFTNGAVWHRLTVENPAELSSVLRLQIAQAWITNVEFYAPDGTGGYAVTRAGGGIPRREWEMADETLPTFQFAVPARKSATLYLRVMSEGVLPAPFLLASVESFARLDYYNNLFMTIFFSVAGAMFFYNLLLYLILKDQSYLWYVVFIAVMTLGLFGFKGYAAQYLWPDSPEWSKRFYYLIGSISQITGVMFARNFLLTRERNPGLDRVLKYFVMAHVVFFSTVYLWPASIFTPASAFGMATPVAFDFLMLYTGVTSLRRGNRSARYYVIASVFTLVGMAVFMLGALGVFHYGFMADNSMAAGFLIDIILFSLALADRITIAQAERNAAQRETQLTLIRAKDELEAKIEERTAALRGEKERAETATMLKDKFVSLVTHDIKSPLAGITLGLEVLTKETGLSPEKRQYAGRLADHSRELLNMTGRLLDLSRLQSGRIVPEKQPVNCQSFAASHIDLCREKADQKGITVINNVPEGMELFADPDLFGECVRNVLSNAVKFCKRGDTITLFNPPGMPATLAVRDTGPGIAPDKMPSLFTAEMKTISLGSDGERGTGVGLPQTRDLMEAHGGSISVESEIGKGSIIYLALSSIKAAV